MGIVQRDEGGDEIGCRDGLYGRVENGGDWQGEAVEKWRIGGVK
jgi:hypothetical protein